MQTIDLGTFQYDTTKGLLLLALPNIFIFYLGIWYLIDVLRKTYLDL